MTTMHQPIESGYEISREEQVRSYAERGWCRFPLDAAITDWIAHALPVARAAIAAPENKQWLRCGGTWHVGVNVLPNDQTGAVSGGPPLSGLAVDFIRQELGMTMFEWDRAQVSVCYPGYPLPMDGETTAAFRFRRDRDAAHVDGINRLGPENRRFLHEYHRFILGIPLVKATNGASPLAVWAGSHKIVRAAFKGVYENLSPQEWGNLDVTDMYRDLRKEVFAKCPRITIEAKPGECYLLHRHTQHGASPWQESAIAGPDGRMIAYFRPDFPSPGQWLFE